VVTTVVAAAGISQGRRRIVPAAPWAWYPRIVACVCHDSTDPSDWPDSTDHRDWNDPTESNDIADPREPHEANDATDPADRNDPVEPMDMIDSLEQIDRTEFLDRIDHRELTTPFSQSSRAPCRPVIVVYPEPESIPVHRCLQIILKEEWSHRSREITLSG